MAAAAQFVRVPVPRSGGRRRAPFGLALGLVALLAACAASGGRAAEEGLSLTGVAPEHLPALEAVQQAVADHDDVVARRILERLLQRRPTGRALELAQAFERILDGRQFVDDLRLSLEGAPDPEDANGFVLWLVVENEGGVPLGLEPGPATLRIHQHVVTAQGGEQRHGRTRTLDTVVVEAVEPGEVRRVQVGKTRPGFALGALAVRFRWALHFRSGSVTSGDESFPAMGIEVRPAEWTALATFLPKETVEPYELVRYLARPSISMPAMMERAVRIAPDRRAEALDLLTPHVRRMSARELQRVIPALRWLADDSRLGGDPAVWKQWFELRAEERPAARAATLHVPTEGTAGAVEDGGP